MKKIRSNLSQETKDKCLKAREMVDKLGLKRLNKIIYAFEIAVFGRNLTDSDRYIMFCNVGPFSLKPFFIMYCQRLTIQTQFVDHTLMGWVEYWTFMDSFEEFETILNYVLDVFINELESPS